MFLIRFLHGISCADLIIQHFQEDAEKCIAVGMNAHLAKPLNIEKMMTTICHLVKKKNE